MAKKIIFLNFLFLFLLANNQYGRKVGSNSNFFVKSDTLAIAKGKPLSKKIEVKSFRNFETLEKYDIPHDLEKNTSLKNIEEVFSFSDIDSLKNKKWLNMAKSTFARIDQTQNYVDLLTVRF